MIVAAVLVIASFVLIAVTVWFWRNTVPDPEALESLVYFEERIVDSTSEPDESQRRRVPRATGARNEHGGFHLPRRFKKGHDEDPTGSIERPVLRRGRRNSES